MADYIPSSNADALVWFNTLNTWVAANGVANGLTLTQVSDFNTLVLDFSAALLAQDTAEAAFHSSVQTTKFSRAAVEAMARLFRLIMTPNMDNAERAAAGYTVPDTTPTPKSAPGSRPVAQVDTSKALQHIVHFADEGTPTSKGKPAGAHHVEIWVKVGDPAPTSNVQCIFAGIDPKTPFLKTFDGADAGKQAHYLLRWVSDRGDPGPWSELHSATITSV